MVLEKKADDQLDRICEKWRDVAKSPGGGEYPTKIKKKGKLTGLATFCLGTAF
jgi:hypothetical protein